MSTLLCYFFNHLYTTFAGMYDFVAWSTSMGQWRRWQSAAMPNSEQNNILELGCGPGHLVADLSQAGHRCAGLDISIQMLKMAKRNLLSRGVKPRLVRARAQTLPFPSGIFSKAIATFPGDFIADPDTLAEVFRVLIPRGEFVIVGLVKITGISFADRFAAWLYQSTGQSGEPQEAWKDVLKEVGFHPRFEIIRQERAQVLRLVGTKSAIAADESGLSR